jgi:hypothetical protein
MKEEMKPLDKEAKAERGRLKGSIWPGTRNFFMNMS